MKIGIVSASRIVKEFLPVLVAMPQVEVAALCVRPQSEAAGRQLTEQYGIPELFTDYEAFLRQPLDAVYIGSANQVHFPQAKQALLAGENVILEKPLTGSLEEAQELFRIADEKGVYLFEAITTFYQEGFSFLRQRLGRIGAVHLVQASFCHYSSRYDDYKAGKWTTTFAPECLGGALNDMNVYNLHLVLGLLDRPKQVEYRANLAPNGVDLSGTAILQYPGCVAVLTATKDCTGVNGCVVQGERGQLVLDGDPNAMEKVYALVGDVREDGPTCAMGARAVAEFAAFERILREQDRAAYEQGKWQSLLVMETLERLHRNTVG